MKFVVVAIVACVLASASASFFGASDKARVSGVLKNVKDLQSAYFAAIGLKALGSEIPSSVCGYAQAANDDDLAELFYAASIVDAFPSCKGKFPDAKKTVEAVFGDNKAEAVAIYRATFIAKTLGLSVDSDSVIESLKTFFEGQAAPTSAGYAFSTAALVSEDAKVLKFFVSEIEDVVAQVEEKNGAVYFSGGVATTVIAIRGIYDLAAAAAKAPEVTSAQVVGFANFLLNNQYVYNGADAATLAIGLRVLSSNKYQVPIIVSSSTTRITTSTKSISVNAATVIGDDTVPLTVEAVFDGADGKKLTLAFSASNGVYVANVESSKLKKGVQSVRVSARPQNTDQTYIHASVHISFSITSAISINDAELIRDGSFGKKSWPLSYPSKFGEKPEFDEQNKIAIKLSIVSSSTQQLVAVHQAFLILTSKQTGKQSVFVGEQLSSKTYLIEVNLEKEAASLNYQSDEYDATVLIGDDAIEQPIEWAVGSVSIRFKSTAPLVKSIDNFHPLPEISHVFRVPEKRPPVIISLVFTAITLAPIVILLLLWIKEKANILDFSASPAALVFHLSVAAILWLYVQFWLSLNMFQTLQILLVLAPITIISGKFTLSAIAAKRAKNA